MDVEENEWKKDKSELGNGTKKKAEVYSYFLEQACKGT